MSIFNLLKEAMIWGYMLIRYSIIKHCMVRTAIDYLILIDRHIIVYAHQIALLLKNVMRGKVFCKIGFGSLSFYASG